MLFTNHRKKKNMEKKRFKWWELLIGATLVPLLAVIIPKIWDLVESKNKEVPRFILSESIFSSNEVIEIIPRNKTAQKKEILDVEWDGFLFSNIKPSHSAHSSIIWKFTPKKIITDDKLIANGTHKIRFCFANGRFSSLMNIKIKPTVKKAEPKKEVVVKKVEPKPTISIAKPIEEKVVKVKKVEPKPTTTSKWIIPTESICQANGGEVDSDGCQATWDNAKKICSASGGELPSREDFHKVIKGCGGIVDAHSDELYINEKNSEYQSCYKREGFSEWGCWTLEEKDSSQAWVVYFFYGADSWKSHTDSYYVLCVSGQ
jgi:hypothetical protein